jgi:hypothetical protein
MKTFTGVVQTENPEDAGSIFFTLSVGKGFLISCRSGAAYKSVKPKKGDKVALTGDTIRDPITGVEAREFFFDSLEILKSNLS